MNKKIFLIIIIFLALPRVDSASKKNRKWSRCSYFEKNVLIKYEINSRKRIDQLIGQLKRRMSREYWSSSTKRRVKKALNKLACAKKYLGYLGYDCHCRDGRCKTSTAWIKWIFATRIHLCSHFWLIYDTYKETTLIHEATHKCGTLDAKPFNKYNGKPHDVGLITWEDIARTYNYWLDSGLSIPGVDH